MSVLTHVIAQFSEGQISITPTVQQPQDIVAAQNGSTGQVLTVPLATLAPVQALQLQSKEDPDIERDKQEIYRHPLFPLMALMFERCEHASATPNFSGTANFDSDIQAFIRHQEKENKTILGENEELNNLMIKAIQVLRIHLMELEKVSDLCKDFCTRYTSCLKGKLQSENLLRTESDYDQSMFDEPPQETPKPVQNMASPSAGNVILQQPFQTSIATVPTLGPGQVMSGGTVYQMVQTAQGLVAQPVQLQPAITSIATPLIHGSTPLSQLGVQAQPSPSATSSTINIVNTVAGVTGFDSDDEDSGKKKNKRGVLPKAATQIMKSWLFQHIVHPYPTEDEKRQIASQTNLTLLQVNNWFINARRRILQPMLDAGNPDQSKAKKAKPQSKPSQRFWPFNSNNSDSSTSYSLKCDESPLPTETVITNSGDTVVLSSVAAAQDSDLTSQNGVVDGGEIYLEMPEESQTSPPSANDKDNTSDNNNNSQNTDNDISDSEDLT